MRKVEKAARGQDLWTDTSRTVEKPFKARPTGAGYGEVDDNEALLGRTMKGGPLDLSASIGGGGEKDVNYNDKAPTKRKEPGVGAY